MDFRIQVQIYLFGPNSNNYIVYIMLACEMCMKENNLLVERSISQQLSAILKNTQKYINHVSALNYLVFQGKVFQKAITFHLLIPFTFPSPVWGMK